MACRDTSPRARSRHRRGGPLVPGLVRIAQNLWPLRTSMNNPFPSASAWPLASIIRASLQCLRPSLRIRRPSTRIGDNAAMQITDRALEAIRNRRQANHAPVLGKQKLQVQATWISWTATKAAVLRLVRHGGQSLSSQIHGSSITEASIRIDCVQNLSIFAQSFSTFLHRTEWRSFPR